MKRFALTATALLLAACAPAHTTASTVTATQTSPAQPTVTQTVGRTAQPPASPKTVIDSHGKAWQVIDNDGTYLVDVDVQPGDYRTAGGAMCYWARLRSLDPSDIIDSKKASSPQVIRIQMSDTAFLTQNCGTWQMIPPF
jgi:ABC-type Fe3+-hydroxamate transport system substrate-binding protein